MDHHKNYYDEAVLYSLLKSDVSRQGNLIYVVYLRLFKSLCYIESEIGRLWVAQFKSI